ncbi:MAG: hypothetical protein KJ630_04140 [Proteobacteria bacterium]|nr:hypothetical protein [Pseudomonadota bacterium]
MMTASLNQSRAVPFPHIPEALRRQYSIEPLYLGSLGQSPEALEIDFCMPQRPLLETQILSCCTKNSHGEAPEPDFFWDLSVGTRTFCMLIIAALGAESSPLPIDLRCPNRSCGEELEMGLSLDDIFRLPAGNNGDGRVEVSVAAGPISFRLPRGRDQLAWQQGFFADEMIAARAMIKTLAIGEYGSKLEESLSDDEVRDIGKTLAATDSLVDFKLHATCPECQEDGVHRLDLGTLAFRHLRQSQARLLNSVHLLASHYHWTEKEILAVPSWRRNHYLSLLENGDG